MSNVALNTRMVVPPSRQHSSPRAPSASRPAAAAKRTDGDTFEEGEGGSDGFVLPTKDGRTTEPRAATGSVQMQYYGGGVLTKPDVKNVYLGHWWTSADGKHGRAKNDAFMKDLVKNTGYTSVWAQYGVGKGSTEKSAVVDHKFGKAHVFKQADLEKMVKHLASKGAGKQEIFNLVLPPGGILETSDGTTSKMGLGGFHGSVKIHGKEVFYSAICYSKGDNGIDFTGGKAIDNVTITESHEISEAATDPHVQDAIDTGNYGHLGWMDMSYGEIGDVEVNDAGPGTPLSTMYGRMDGYAVQKIWSQVDHTNEIRAKHPGPVKKPVKTAAEVA